MVGPFPPPVHGNALVTQAVANHFSASAHVVRLSTTPGKLNRGLTYHARKASRVPFSLQRVLTAPRHDSCVYVAVDAGRGSLYTSLFLRAARARGLRSFAHHHSFSYLDRFSPRMSRLVKAAGPACRHILLCERMTAAFRDLYSVSRPVFTIGNAFVVDPSDGTPGSDRRFTVGHLSNLGVEKGLYDVLDTFAMLRCEDPRARLILAGPTLTDRDDQAIRNAAFRSPDAVEYRGAVHDSEKEKFFGEIGVFLFPTRYEHEAQPLVVLEALSRGIPVLAFGRGCIPDLLPDGSGHVFAADADFSALASNRLLAWFRDPDDYMSMSRLALARFTELRRRSLESLQRLTNEVENPSRT